MCKVNTAGFVCITGRTLLREKYPFTGDFGNTNAGPPTSEPSGGREGGGEQLKVIAVEIVKHAETKYWIRANYS